MNLVVYFLAQMSNLALVKSTENIENGRIACTCGLCVQELIPTAAPAEKVHETRLSTADAMNRLRQLFSSFQGDSLTYSSSTVLA